MSKTIVVIGLTVILNIHAYGQGFGIFEMSNVGTTPDRHIYLDQYLTGPKPEGEGYQIAIFWGPEGTLDENALIQLGDSTGFIVGAGGQFSDGLRTVVDPGATMDGPVGTFQARAWDVSSGATWAQAVANPDGRTGKGPMFEMKTKDPLNLMEPTPRIADAAGWRGFAIVPEPSVLGLALLGATSLLIFRRRR